ncbi:unnamed protein product [Adineta ricciae]|uniref:Uncharacterized protein n=1 Tax=Adineta ricciae TaxID=249248 RepID=A0A815U8Q3_ADIRI|nr:unnamed protein product [Adineta ricciae]CAF1663177.1 unnamed protein product [Adineta ricciae]
MTSKRRAETQNVGIYNWIRNNWFSIALLLTSCVLFSIVIILIPSLISLYLADHGVAITKSDQNYTDLWAIRYLTNVNNLHQISTRAVTSPYDKSALGRAMVPDYF